MTQIERPNSFTSLPDEHGHFGMFGGRYVAETLMPLVAVERSQTVDPEAWLDLALLRTV